MNNTIRFRRICVLLGVTEHTYRLFPYRHVALFHHTPSTICARITPLCNLGQLPLTFLHLGHLGLRLVYIVGQFVVLFSHPIDFVVRFVVDLTEGFYLRDCYLRRAYG